MKKIYLFTIIACSALLFSSCLHDEIYDDTPEANSVAVTLDWSGIGTGVAQPTQTTFTIDNICENYDGDSYICTLGKTFEPGKYSVYIYNTPANITVAGSVASVATAASPAGFVQPLADWFFSYAEEVAIESNKACSVTAVMKQQVRELTLTITPDGTLADKVEGVSATLSGVAGAWNMETDVPDGAAASVTPVFVKQANGDYQATVRLLGISGAKQKLEGAISFTEASGYNAVEFTKELHEIDGFAAFNDNKKIPLALTAQVVEVNGMLTLGDFEITAGWTGDEESGTATDALKVSAGELEAMIMEAGLDGATSLKLRGTLDKRDFIFMREEMPNLAVLDLSKVSITEIKLDEADYPGDPLTYPANELPRYAFCNGRTWSSKISLTTIVLPESVIAIGDYALFLCKGLTGDLTIPEGITTIGISAFQNCRNFSGNLTIPSNVTTIKNSAFTNCSGFDGDLTIPASVTTIEKQAFSNCMNFSGLIILEGIKTIGDQAFFNCKGFTGSLTIPASVKTIGQNTFYGCKGFDGNLIIPASVETIGAGAFFDCSGFTGSLIIPASVETIGQSAFYGCSGFDGSLTIPASVETIGQSAFYGCSGFDGSLTIPEGVETIGQQAFYDCKGFNGSLTIPTSVTTIENKAFFGCNSFTDIQVYWGNPIAYNTDMFPAGKDVYVPMGTKGLYEAEDGWTPRHTIIERITSGGLEAMITAAGLINATELKLTGTLDKRDFIFMRDEMPNLAVLDLSKVSITAVNLGTADYTNDPLTYPANELPRFAFQNGKAYNGKTSLTTIVFPENITSIGQSAFYNCKGLTGDLTIPEGITTIGVQAFDGCSGFTGNLTIPASVTTINNYAFYGCNGFTGNLTIPGSVKIIGDKAFQYCSGFNGSLSISEGVEIIGDAAFRDCSGFTGSLTIPGSVTTIGEFAFYGCKGFTGSLIISEGVKTIESFAFRDCNGFTGSLTIPASVETIGGQAFYGCSGFNGSLSISEGVETIEYLAFYGCSGFTGSLTIPEGVTTIEEWAFKDCSGFDGSLTIPVDVETIELRAFDGCDSFTDIQVYWDTPIPYTEDMLPAKTIYIPAGKANAYTAEDGWRGHTIVER